jgi:hypothetical protein
LLDPFGIAALSGEVGSISMMSCLAFLCQRPDMFQKGGENVARFLEDERAARE